MNRKSIHKKLLVFLILMGMLPLLVVLIYSGLRLTTYMEKHAQETCWMKNSIISEHLTNLLQNNFYVLHTLANAPTVLNYIKNPNPADEAVIRQLLRNNDELFHDKNLTAITDSKGMQLIRSDNTALVNISQRRHFQEAMTGKDFVSDVIISMSTGKMIVVLTVPIFDENHQPIGVLQRNFSLENFNTFLQQESEHSISCMVMDRENKIIAHYIYIMTKIFKITSRLSASWIRNKGSTVWNCMERNISSPIPIIP